MQRYHSSQISNENKWSGFHSEPLIHKTSNILDVINQKTKQKSTKGLKALLPPQCIHVGTPSQVFHSSPLICDPLILAFSVFVLPGHKNERSEMLMPNDAGLVGWRKLRQDHTEQLQVYSEEDASNSTHPHTPESR